MVAECPASRTVVPLFRMGRHDAPVRTPGFAFETGSNGKLSKRDGDRLGFPVFPLEWHDPKSGEVSSGYRESGYLPKRLSTSWPCWDGILVMIRK